MSRSQYMRVPVLIAMMAFFCVRLIAEKVSIGAEPRWLYKVSPGVNCTPAAKTISNGYYVELFDHQVNLGTNTEYTHLIRQIVNETGVQNESEISVTFAPEYQQVVFHKILLIRNGTAINQLNARQIKVVQEETDAADFQYNGLKRAYILLKDVQKGDRIEAAYSLIGFNPVFANKYSDKIYFVKSTAICNYFETILVPSGRKLMLRSFNKAPQAVQLLQNNTVVYQWNNPALATYQSDDNTPSWYEDDPYVSVTEYDNWQQVVNWGLQTFRNYQYPLPGVLQAHIGEWQAAAHGDNDVFATHAIRFVQDQVRYLGLEIGAYTHQPHTPVEVYQQRYGDCKDKALLLTMVLRQQGIPAYIALVSTSAKGRLSEAAPSTGEFDHAIVAIGRGKGYLYVDPTDIGQRGGLANLYIPAYGYALVIKPGEDKLEPVEPGFLNATAIEARLDVSYHDSSYLKVSTTYSGGSADAVRSSMAGYSGSELEDDYLQYYAKTFEGIKQADTVQTADDSIKNEVTIRESYVVPVLWHSSDRGKESFEVFAKALYNEIPKPSTSGRDAPLALDYPASIRYRMVVNLPEKWNLGFEDIHIKNDSYQFDFVSEIAGSRVIVRYYWKTFKDHIAKEDIRQYKKDYKRITDVIDCELYRDTGEAHSHTTVGSAEETGTNWKVVGYVLLLAIMLAFLFRHLDRYTIDHRVRDEQQMPLGGWVIVLGISLLLGGLSKVVDFSEHHYFSRNLWIQLQESGGLMLQLLVFAGLTLSVIELCAIIPLLYWYAGCRDIFPRLFLYYTGLRIAGALLMVLLSAIIHYPASFGDLQQEMISKLVSTCIYGGIWGAYIIRSERVRNTFTRDR